MQDLLAWQTEPATPPVDAPSPALADRLPAAVAAALWHGNELGQAVTAVESSGWEALDAELPGGGWPRHSIAEVLSPQPSVLEWRLLAPSLRVAVAAGGEVVVIGPPRHPHLPGLVHEGLDERQLVWIQAEAPAERLWVTEQLIKSFDRCHRVVAAAGSSGAAASTAVLLASERRPGLPVSAGGRQARAISRAAARPCFRWP